MNIGIIYNHSSKWHKEPALQIADAIRDAGHDPIIKTNSELYTDTSFDFEKCVFLDKDFPLAQRLELAGIRLFNNAGAIEICDDKRKTYEMMSNDFPMPKTEIFPLTYFINDAFAIEYAHHLTSSLRLPIVAKFASGSQGREVFLLKTEEELIKFICENYAKPHLYQQFISESFGKDLRVYVVGNKVEGAMLRQNDSDFRSNIAMGGCGIKYEVTDDIAKLCTDITSLLGLDFAGIDLLFGKNNEMLVCEVNSNALFSSLNNICNVNIGRSIAEYVINTKNLADMMF